MPRFCNYRYEEMVAAIFEQFVNRAHQNCEMHCRGCSIACTKAAIKIPEVNACGQHFGALAFDVFTDVVFGGIEQSVAIFAVDVE